MNIEDLQNITYRRQRYMNRDSRSEAEEVESRLKEDKDKEDMGDDEKTTFNSLISALNDLAKGQKEMLAAINRLADKPGESQNNLSNNGEGGSHDGGRVHARTTMQSHPHLYSGSTRPTLPQFLDGTTAGMAVQAEQEPYGAYLRSIGLWGMISMQLCPLLIFVP